MNRHTDKNKTNEILMGYVMSDGRLNVEYLNENLILWCDNVKRLYDEVPNKRRSCAAMACMVVVDFLDTQLATWNPGQGLVCTTRQIEAFLKKTADGWSTLDPLVAHIEELRQRRAAR